MRDTEKHNGWANYSTWRVHLEVFDGAAFDQRQTADSAREWVESWIDELGTNSTLVGWLDAFLADVDWQEIADHLNEAVPAD